ncbi:MAG: LacI family DNA-binding transcriptional regulator [Lachnospiraceae bacterium]|nr:LacI family DNA-binding transcriptional regulator [Lachnospiraceae bacterium]
MADCEAERMTIKDVANLAGVSPASVSRYFNGGALGKEKRQKILDVVEKTGFRPNAAAKTMRTGKSGLIGIILPHIHSDSVSRIMDGIEKALQELDVVLLLGYTEGKPDRETRYLKAMQENGVEGILFMGAAYTPELRDALEGCRIPLIVTGQSFPGVSCVCHDDYGAMRALTERMIAKGREKLLYLGVEETDRAAGKERRRGVEDACQLAGLKAPRFYQADFTFQGGKAAASEAFLAYPEIDGVLCANDYAALGAMRALSEMGLKVPEEVSVAGIGDNWAGEIATPGLTSAHLYYEDCGATAVRMLLALMGQGGTGMPRPVREVKLSFSITERGSL